MSDVSATPRKNIELPCGCEFHYEIDPPGWVPCVTHRREQEAELKLEEAFGVPRCPEPGCGADARRPKCMFEMGSYCPRMPVLDDWRNMIKAAARYLATKEMIEGE